MKVKTTASIIHVKQFREWRMSGIEFQFGDARYDTPNRSCAGFIEGTNKRGTNYGIKTQVRGYWLDILIGPYIAHGIECDTNKKFANDLLLVTNKGTGSEQHRHDCVELSLYNIIGFMWEIEV